METYIDFANEKVEKGELTAGNYKTYILSKNHCFCHFKNIKSRLNKIGCMLNFSKMQLNTQ